MPHISQFHSYPLDRVVQPGTAFPNLTALSLSQIQDAFFVAPFLSAISPHGLERLKVVFDIPESLITASINDIFEATLRLQAFVHLTLRQSTLYINLQMEGMIDIRPLLRFRKLKVLEISLHVPSSLFATETIAEFGRAWCRGHPGRAHAQRSLAVCTAPAQAI